MRLVLLLSRSFCTTWPARLNCNVCQRKVAAVRRSLSDAMDSFSSRVMVRVSIVS